MSIKAHDNDTGLTGAWATATWLLDYDADTPKGYQMFRSVPMFPKHSLSLSLSLSLSPAPWSGPASDLRAARLHFCPTVVHGAQRAFACVGKVCRLICGGMGGGCWRRAWDRLLKKGLNSSGKDHLHLGGIELYGDFFFQ